jgi:TetR/AcrR family transcriptional regulator, regulator of biofilm formation and stress response
MREGIVGVTHRAVASEAALPLAATTYYFANADELIAEAARAVSREWLDRATSEVLSTPQRRRNPRTTAKVCVRLALGDAVDTESLLWRCESYVEAHRHPALRGVIAESNATLENLLAQALARCGFKSEPEDARLMLAAIDGAVLHAIATRTDPRGLGAIVVARLVASLPKG